MQGAIEVALLVERERKASQCGRHRRDVAGHPGMFDGVLEELFGRHQVADLVVQPAGIEQPRAWVGVAWSASSCRRSLSQRSPSLLNP